MKVYLETLGCQMNRLDSELVAGLLRAAGHEMTGSKPGADVVLYNTCSVRDHAEEKVHSRLGADGQQKLAGPRPIVGVLGCMAQRLGARLRERHPCVDIVCGPGRLCELPEMLVAAAAGQARAAPDPDRRRPPYPTPPSVAEAEPPRDPAAGPNSFQAYVRVARGCDKFCSYCIVPFVRGRSVSRDPRLIVEEVRRLVGAGRTEITLLGQTVNSYAWRAGRTPVRFSDLLERAASVAGLRRLRFLTSHPADFGDDILEAMRELPCVCEYIHCPAQSGADGVLKRMNRGYTRSEYDDLVNRTRSIVPGVVLAGDFIVGFPGETDEDHAASAELIRRSGYKNSFIFKYSPRPGTSGARRLVDDVPAAVKKRRNNELLAVQEQVGLAHHRAYVGRTVEVLVSGRSKRSDKQARPPRPGSVQLAGRTRGDHIVVFDSPESLIGRYVDVTVTGATAVTLFAEPA